MDNSLARVLLMNASFVRLSEDEVAVIWLPGWWDAPPKVITMAAFQRLINERWENHLRDAELQRVLFQ